MESAAQGWIAATPRTTLPHHQSRKLEQGLPMHTTINVSEVDDDELEPDVDLDEAMGLAAGASRPRASQIDNKETEEDYDTDIQRISSPTPSAKFGVEEADNPTPQAPTNEL
jgi:hypothetical protein